MERIFCFHVEECIFSLLFAQTVDCLPIQSYRFVFNSLNEKKEPFDFRQLVTTTSDLPVDLTI